MNGSNGYGTSATASMTNILVLNELGKEIANVMVTSLPSWQRFDEGKVEIHNGGGGRTGNGNLASGGGLAAYVNYQCAPMCRRVPDPAENASQGGK